MNRAAELRKRQYAAKHQKETKQKELESDIKKKADACRRFIGDKRHAEYKAFWLEIRSGLQDKRDNLSENIETNDAYLRQALILDTQIKTITWILDTPEKFILIDENIKEKEQGQ